MYFELYLSTKEQAPLGSYSKFGIHGGGVDCRDSMVVNGIMVFADLMSESQLLKMLLVRFICTVQVNGIS